VSALCVCVVLLTVCPVAFSFFSFSWDFFSQTTSRNSIQNAYSDDDQFLLFGLNKRNDGTDIPGDMRKEGSNETTTTSRPPSSSFLADMI
jgi:hypothetical protein